MNNVFQEIKKICLSEEKYKKLLFLNPFFHRLFYGLIEVNDEDRIKYLLSSIVAILENQEEIYNKLLNYEHNFIKLNKYMFPKELLNQYIFNLSFKEKIKLLFKGRQI
jgi:hypothetical protein